MVNTYRILLVDDEEEVRTSIIQKIDWVKTGFTVVGDAENGEDALEKIEQMEPDVVLTDIRMPYMDGLQLAERLRRDKPSVKVVIFSGFDDFEYAKKAIKLNIIEYILKPVNAEELTGILKKIKLQLDGEIARIKDVNALNESYEKSLPVLRENFLNSLLRGDIKENQIESLIREYRLDIGKSGLWAAVKINIDSFMENNFDTEAESLITISVKRLFDSHLKNFCNFISFHSYAGLVALVGVNHESEFQGVMNRLSQVCRESRRILNQKITIGVGSYVNSLAALNLSFGDASEAVGYGIADGGGDAIFINDVHPVKNTPIYIDGKMESDLVNAVKFGGEKTIAECAEKIADNMKGAAMARNSAQAYIISVFSIILQIIQRYELDHEEIFGVKADYYDILTNIRDFSALKKWLLNVCLKISRSLNTERQDTTQNMILNAKRYIKENYANPELSLETICGYLHISPTYFSTVFKREVGESYTSYLTGIRLEKAAELLSTTDEKTYVIAKQTGYEEPNYFGYVFKKKYGVSPNKYRGK